MGARRDLYVFSTPYITVCVCVRFLCVLNIISTDQALELTILSNLRGCQSGSWSAGQEKMRETSTKLQREGKTKTRQKMTERRELKIFRIEPSDPGAEWSSIAMIEDSAPPLPGDRLNSRTL